MDKPTLLAQDKFKDIVFIIKICSNIQLTSVFGHTILKRPSAVLGLTLLARESQTAPIPGTYMGPAMMKQALTIALNAHRKGDLPMAEQGYRAVLDTEPDNGDAWHFLGLLLQAKGEAAAAEASLAKAAERLSTRADIATDYGRCLQQNGAPDQALNWFETAVQRQPNYLPALIEQGNCLLALGAPERALAAYQHALQIYPAEPDARANLGFVEMILGQFDAARASFNRVLAVSPDHAPSRFHLGLLHLTEGDYETGFALYRWRRAVKGSAQFRQSLRGTEEWDGRPLGAQDPLLISAEQGYGDVIQCLRFIPEICKRAARVYVVVPEALRDLVTAQGWPVTVLAPETALPLANLRQITMMELPRVLGLRRETLNAAPYLSVPPEASARPAQPQSGTAKLIVGLVWAGNPTRDLDRLRSMPLSDLRPLADLADMQYVSLQVGAAGAQRQDVWPELADLAPALTDFTQTAAALSRIDVLVSIDTSVAHLAGALGVKTLILLEKVPDWRYGISGTTSPWYASQHCCRQHKPGDWPSAVAQVPALLAEIRSRKQK